jgi:hypothetical protein
MPFALSLRSRLALAALLLGAACGTPKKTPPQNAIVVIVERGDAPTNIDHVDVDIAGLGMDVMGTGAKTSGATELELPDTVRIELPSTAKGTAMITVVARDANGAELARGTANEAFTSPEVVTVMVTLSTTKGPAPDAGMPSADAGPTSANLTVDMPSVDLGDVIVGQTSAPTVLKVTNTGQSDSGPVSVTLGGSDPTAFMLGSDDACSGQKLMAGQSCTFSVVFMPDQSGALGASIDVSAMPGGTVTVVLTGSGLGLGRLMLVPSMNDFGSVVVGQSGTPVDFTVTNSGQSATGTITVALGQPGSDYALTNDACSRQSLAAGASCTISVRFQPASAIVLTATLAVSAKPGGVQVSALFGRGLTPASLSAQPSPEDFGSVVTGENASGTITITNSGGVPTGTLASTLGGADSGEFTIMQDHCAGAPLMARASCTIVVEARPSTTGMKQASLTVSGGASVTVALSMNALAPGSLSIAPTTDTYPAVLIATDGATHTFTVTNRGGGATGNLSASLTGSGASQFVIASDACSNHTLAGGATCTIGVRFHPTARGGQTASLLVSATPGGAVTASLSATGLAPAALTGDASMTNFGTVDVSRSSPAFTWTITNSGDVTSGPLQTTLSGSTGDFAVMNHCTNGQTLAGGASCTIVLSFAPASSGAKSLTITVAGTPGGSAVLTATGTGRAPVGLTVALGGTGAGSVTSDVGGINCGTACSASYVFGTMVTLTATPRTGSTFGGWSGACSGTGSCVVTMTQAQSVTASFTLNTYALTVTGVPSGSNFTSNPALTCANGTCTGTFGYGTSVALTSASNAQYTFNGYTGGGCSTAGMCTVTITGPTTVAASFTLNNYTVTVTRPLGATLTTSPALNCAGATCSASLSYGTAVMLTAANDAQYNFTSYTGGGCGTNAVCNFTVQGTTNVTANYSTNSYAVTVTGVPAGASFSSMPALTCANGSCTGTLAYGTSLILTAATNAQYTFNGYSGGGCSSAGMCTVTITGATTVNASYSLNSYPITVNGVPSGAGFTSSPALTCANGSCTGTFAYGTLVTLTGSSNAQYTFNDFSGGCTGASCNVTITGATTVTASYGLNSYPVTVTFPVGATLTVVSNPALSCIRGTCSGTLAYGTAVTVTASNDAEYNFSSYTGATCGANATCTFTVQGTTSVTANFNLNAYTVTVVAGAGGTTTVNNALGACASGCTFNWGTQVTIDATPNANWGFSFWSDAGAPQTSSRTITVTGDFSTTASFFAFQASLFNAGVSRGGSALLTGDANSTSASPTNAITYSCSGDVTNQCPGSWSFDQGTEAVFTATPDPGGWFIQAWVGNIVQGIVPTSATEVHVSNVGTAAQGVNWIVPARFCFTGTFLIQTVWALLNANCGRQDMAVPATQGFNAIGVDYTIIQ